jgi:hypothetical protein
MIYMWSYRIYERILSKNIDFIIKSIVFFLLFLWYTYALCLIGLLNKTSRFIRYPFFIESLSLLIYLLLIKSFIIYFKTFTVIMNLPLSMPLYLRYGFWHSYRYVLKIFRSLPTLLLSLFILYYSLFVMHSILSNNR